MFYKKHINNYKKSFVLILTTLLTLLGCKTKEEKYLQKHQVIFCKTSEFEQFVKNAKVKPTQARDLMIEFANKNN